MLHELRFSLRQLRKRPESALRALASASALEHFRFKCQQNSVPHPYVRPLHDGWEAADILLNRKHSCRKRSSSATFSNACSAVLRDES